MIMGSGSLVKRRAVLLALLLVLILPLTGMQASADDRIYDEVRRKLANDPDVKGGAFEIEVKDGVVTLRGTVDKDKFKEKAERLAKKVKGVRQVINNLEVRPR